MPCGSNTEVERYSESVSAPISASWSISRAGSTAGMALTSGLRHTHHAKPRGPSQPGHWRLDKVEVDRRVQRIERRGVETTELGCQRSGLSIEVSPNSPRSAKSTASETPGGGGSAAGGTSSGAVILQACGHSVTLGRQRELVVISARHPAVLATPARQTRIELRLQWFIR